MELAIALTIGSFSVGVATGVALIVERILRARMLYIKTKRIERGFFRKSEIEESLIDESSFEVVERTFYRLNLELPKHQ